MLNRDAEMANRHADTSDHEAEWAVHRTRPAVEAATAGPPAPERTLATDGTSPTRTPTHTSRTSGASRRGVLLAATGVLTGAAVVTGGTAVAAPPRRADPDQPVPDQAISDQPTSTGRPSGGLPPLIDVHHHPMMPAPVREWLVAHGVIPPTGGPLPTDWDVDTALSTMDQYGIGLALVSAAIPAAFTPTAALALELATVANNSLSEIAHSHPARFGWLATIPLLDAADAVNEVNRAYDILGADGVLLTTHAGTRYLGDPALEPVLAALNARHGVALVHPFDLPGATPIAVPAFLVDYAADTARAAVQLVVSGALDRHPRIRWILAHGGGAFPYIAGRLALGRALGYGAEPAVIRSALRRFWYDTAGPMSPYATPSLLAAAGAHQILFGSDYNAVPAATLGDGIAALRADPMLDRRTRAAIARDNALRLFPALAARLG
ncbi:putative TIM-barrel fold metal-dependent hydrolase [Frankia sp. EI5c]|uniref:amidohydrolase family protein n=1 Tax=Frankia sp. EI5c TaxID=683316 RepID=UPI0007C3800C|nr:amidohydrolase family protein [Frankia sp. EI5c]OAA29587.1 putative TIM-barrel fold metal-dependent hydrolase [Frankia sp. EI5c]